MEFDLDEIIQAIVEMLGDTTIDFDIEEIMGSLIDQGIDLTQFTVEEIQEALDSALEADSHSSMETSEYNVTFGARHFDGFIDQHETITLKSAGSDRWATFDVYVRAGTNSIYISDGSCYPVKLTGTQVSIGGQRYVVK